jgi:hypothetical protein
MFQEAVSKENVLSIQSINCELLLEDVYEKVNIEQENIDITREIPPEE